MAATAASPLRRRSSIRQQLAALGIDHAIFNTPRVHEPEFFDLMGAEVIPAVEKIAVAGR